MNNIEENNSEIIKIQGVMDRFLKARAAGETHFAHLDEDALNAFIEGNLAERETTPLIKHLIDCSYCLRVTAELFRIEEQFAAETISISPASAAPTSVSEVLQSLMSRIFGTSDNAVFAHQEDEKVEKEKEVDSEGKSS